jgi:hypothetical protein
MYEAVAESNHGHHGFAKGWVQVAGLGQDMVYIAAFLGVSQLIGGDNVRGNVSAAFHRRLECALDRQLARQVSPKGLQRDYLLFP